MNNFRRRATDMLDTGNLTDSQRLLIIQSRVLALEERLDRHHKMLIEGDNDLPIAERVRNLENFAKLIRFWLRTVAVAIVLQTITFGAAAVVYFIKLFPILQEIAKNP